MGGVLISYFEKYYGNVRLPYDFDKKEGFRRAQIGAIHSIASHFINSKETGIVNMPTGSGKTAVIMLSPYILKSKRMLIITPSKLVRNQIFVDFSDLATLDNVGAFSGKITKPKVYEVKGRITNEEDWGILLDYDVVIATPNSISPSVKEVMPGSKEMFDLVVVDEGHHSAAKTWKSIIDYYDNSIKILFSATPFRRDKKEIKGKFLYYYSVADAYRDGIFGDIEYIPVTAIENSNDYSIAKKAEFVYQMDRKKGLNHRLMVRSDSIIRSKELFELYEKFTNLRLIRIDGSSSDKFVKDVICKLKDGELDGVICVNLMGEGFDLPILKIAALHSPHKSLEVTLQFIGRFARVNASNIGIGKFIAIESEIKLETYKLFEEDTVWQDIIANLSDGRILAEIEQKSLVNGFEEVINSDNETADISMYSLKPFVHAKVYQTNRNSGIDFGNAIYIGEMYEIINKQVNTIENLLVVIYKERVQPKWTTLNMFSHSVYEILVVYYDKDTSLLYINTSRKQDLIYDNIVESISTNIPKRLSMVRINKVLLDISNQEFFNIGMRNGISSSNTEAYRIMAGPNAHKSIATSDTTHFQRGHCFVKGNEKDKDITIGYSSGSKIWSNGYYNLLEYKKWCSKISKKIISDKEVITHTAYDELMLPETISNFPEAKPLVVIWDKAVYLKQDKLLEYGEINFMITDLEIKNIYMINNVEIAFQISYDKYFSEVKYCLDKQGYKIILKENINFARTSGLTTLQDYLTTYPFTLYFNDFTAIFGDEISRYTFGKDMTIDSKSLISKNWSKLGVDIENECNSKIGKTIQAGVYELISETNFEFVFFDHNSGEIADFITAYNDVSHTNITFYHCKSAGGSKPGNRVKDVYEVCGQSIKSMMWSNQNFLIKKLKNREKLHSKNIREFKSDNVKVLEDLLRKSNAVRFETVIVQPGITKKNLSLNHSNLLAASNDFIKNQGFEKLLIWCSN